jgi:MinD-like ATPase involved in chromosome partitioning or flagellar assembly
VIDCLAELVGLDIGTIPRHPVDDKPRGQPAPDLHDLLHAALCAEVRRFCTARNVKSIAPDFEDVVARISCPVVSVGSRKGGTGKSVLLAAIISWFKRRRPDSRVCLLDLDLSGPIWQYLLFPSRNSPGRFLDDILDLHQRPFGFRFPVPTPNGIIELVRKAPCPFSLGTEVSHLGVRDLPSINRLLLLAAEMSRTDFYTFIARVIEQLSASHELILIDNSPGFDSIPLCTHTIASSAMRGAALVVSTPALPDLAGTFLELADLRLIEFKRPPFWIVNKATACSRDFLSHKWSAYQIAKMLKAYDGVLPETPLIASALRPSDVTNFWHAVSMDESLLDFSFLDGTGHAKMPDLARTRFGKETEALFNRVLAPIVD